MVFRSFYQSLSFGYASHIDSTIGNWLGKMASIDRASCPKLVMVLMSFG